MSNRTLTVIVVVFALLALGWLWTGGRMPQRPTAEAAPLPPAPTAAPDIRVMPAAATKSAAPVEPTPAQSTSSVKHLRVAIENTKPGIAPAPLRATQSDSLTIDITSDRAGTVEIHGYGKKIEVAPGSVATLAFVANIAGRFPVDLHGRDGRHIDVTALEVQPR
jgi:hypothetical protein